MSKYWVSWYSGYHADEGCTEPPFQVWITGSRQRPHYGLTEEQNAAYLKLKDLDEDASYDFLDEFSKDDATIVALVEAESTDEIWEVVAKHFPDYQERFCDVREEGFGPGDRFPDFENRTSLHA